MGRSKDGDARKRSSPSSRVGEDEGRRKRRKSKEDDTKSKSKKRHRSHKTSKSCSDRDEKSSGKIKDKGPSKHGTSSKLNFQELSIDDYFAKNNEFSTWLKQERNVFFSDLSSGSARDLFSEFVKVWNKKELDRQYYDGIDVALRTSHQWNIKK